MGPLVLNLCLFGLRGANLFAGDSFDSLDFVTNIVDHEATDKAATSFADQYISVHHQFAANLVSHAYCAVVNHVFPDIYEPMGLAADVQPSFLNGEA